MYQRYKESLMANKLKVVLFLGSVRENRLGERVALFMKNVMEEKNYEVEIMDPMKTEFPMLKKAFHHYQDKTQAPQYLQECNAKIQAADAFVIVSAEYNHSIPPALSNMMDHFGSSGYSYKPSGIVCYSPGQYGGMRAAMQLRSFLGELGCLSVSNIFGIPQVSNAIDAEGNPTNEHMTKGAHRLLAQLEWHAHAMKNHREKHGVPQ